MEYTIFELLEKYHKNNKYEMMTEINLKRDTYDQDLGIELYKHGGKYILELTSQSNSQQASELISQSNSQQASEQGGGEATEVKIGEKKYIFDVYKKKDGDLRRVFIKSFRSKSPNIEEDHCAQLAYTSNSTTLKIESLNGLRGCIKLKSNESGKIEKQGTMLIYAIIEWAKNKEFKKIVLEDMSKIICKDSKINISYSLYYGYILQSGYPWYWKFGFRYEDEESNMKLEENKKILENLKVESIGYEDIISILMLKLELERYIDTDMLDNKKILRNISKMTMIYKKHINDKNVYDFFREMYIECCEIMSLITLNISRSLKLNDVRGSTVDEIKKMVLVLM